jgi:hypothetical protein
MSQFGKCSSEQITVSDVKRTSESITIANLRRSQKRKAAEEEHEEDIFEIEYPSEEHFKSDDRHPNILLRFLLEVGTGWIANIPKFVSSDH